MRAFSASQAVSPAIERTKRYLFGEFEFTTYLKLAAVACISLCSACFAAVMLRIAPTMRTGRPWSSENSRSTPSAQTSCPSVRAIR